MTCSLLIVDDDPLTREVLRHFLAPHDFEITDAADGPEALALLRQHPFDLVLLDVVLPGMSGLEVLRELRRTHGVSDLPVILATAKDQPSDVVEGLQAGANDYVTKPFDFPVVLARARTQLALKESVDRARRLEQSLAQRNAELEQAFARMRQDLEAAGRVQEGLLPHNLPPIQGAEVAWCYRPCAELAGDLLNAVPLGERYLCLYVLDVVHHGVKAALWAVMINRVLARALTTGQPPAPAEVAALLNREFPWDDKTQQFFTLLFGVLDLPERRLRLVAAGHEGPLHLSRHHDSVFHRYPSTPIGWGDGKYQEQVLELAAGDRLYFYTDGLPEALAPGPRQFTDARVRETLEEARDRPLGEGLARLLRRVEEWSAPEAPHDDLSILAVELR
jgi:sigma-B regulation protein RsbU (phosphoserine phosphatase)